MLQLVAVIQVLLSIFLIILIFGIAFLYARRQGPADQEEDDAATALLTKE